MQLRFVEAARFRKRALLRRGERSVFDVVESEVARLRPSWRVHPQTNLGEFLGCDNDAAFRSINSKRVDMLVVDKGGFPMVAVEYQGSGHYLGDGAARDAVKRAALQDAGIGYIEIFPDMRHEEIRRVIAAALVPENRT